MTHTDPDESELVAARLRTAIQSGDIAAFGAVLDDNVRWGGEADTPETCHNRAQVVERLSAQRAAGMETEILEVVPARDAVLLGLNVKRPVHGGFARERTIYQVLKVRDRRVVDIRGYGSRAQAAAQAGVATAAEHAFEARQLIPILNISNLSDSFAWFAKLGWDKKWDWGEADGPAAFGAVSSGSCEIFLCLNGQGGRWHDGGIAGGDQGVWLSVWVDDVDVVHAGCVREGLEVLRPPLNEPWGVREMHVRHPDGHVFRISQPAHSH
jgi:glyoxalase/bleomycin resistance protein/dioxygenase superfamily protein